MKKNAIYLLVDVAAMLSLLSVACTGLILRWILPPGSRGGAGLSLWGWTRHEWGDLHFYLVGALGGVLLVHLALHWGWICSVVRNACTKPDSRTKPIRPNNRNPLGAAMLLMLAAAIGLFLWSASNQVNDDGPKHRQQGGSMRLRHGETDLRE